METDILSAPFPQWLDDLYPSEPGFDNLGLASVSSAQIFTTLSPSINVLNFHPRYFSFYAFLLYEFWQRKDLPKDNPTWRKFFRERDFIYSVANYLCEQPEHGDLAHIVGGQKTASLARQSQSFSTDFKYIQSPFGAYGLHYRTVMAQLGLIIQSEKSSEIPIDFPTEPLGQAVAKEYQAIVKDTTY